VLLSLGNQGPDHALSHLWFLRQELEALAEERRKKEAEVRKKECSLSRCCESAIEVIRAVCVRVASTPQNLCGFLCVHGESALGPM